MLGYVYAFSCDAVNLLRRNIISSSLGWVLAMVQKYVDQKERPNLAYLVRGTFSVWCLLLSFHKLADGRGGSRVLLRAYSAIELKVVHALCGTLSSCNFQLGSSV